MWRDDLRRQRGGRYEKQTKALGDQIPIMERSAMNRQVTLGLALDGKDCNIQKATTSTPMPNRFGKVRRVEKFVEIRQGVAGRLGIEFGRRVSH